MSPAVRASAPAESRPPDFREPGSAPRWRVGLGAVVIVVLVLIGVGVVLSAVASARESMSTTDSGGSSGVVDFATGSVDTSTPAGRSVFVHLLGRVAHPGLYEVEAGSRAVDVVTAAGGFAAEADESALNLARPVTDGEQIVVPRVGRTRRRHRRLPDRRVPVPPRGPAASTSIRPTRPPSRRCRVWGRRRRRRFSRGGTNTVASRASKTSSTSPASARRSWLRCATPSRSADDS
ncbi:SLBB domain-containing protein [Frondihabitans sucicola]|uniref:SLBB domain-containing protein n=1 Tax=Frondihabitans sucicola TaxID=1268041 RepID=UPI003D9BEDB2